MKHNFHYTEFGSKIHVCNEHTGSAYCGALVDPDQLLGCQVKSDDERLCKRCAPILSLSEPLGRSELHTKWWMLCVNAEQAYIDLDFDTANALAAKANRAYKHLFPDATWR